jgi:hypothetical protein
MSEIKRIEKLETEVADLKSLLRKVLDPEGKLDVNITIQELAVHVTNNGKKAVNVDTTGLPGKILFCALKDQQAGTSFREAEMSRLLDERGWHSPHGTLGPQLSKMVGTMLVRDKDGYRLPTKVTFTGDEL